MKNADQPAMPTQTHTFPDMEDGGQAIDGFWGLTKRERFAMAAMQGLLTNRLTISSIVDNLKRANGDYETKEVSEILAMDAVQHADALLKELEATDAD